MTSWSLRRLRKFLVALSNILIVFDIIPRSIAISQSKREGHTTPHSVFITTNVSIWQNFGFDAPSEHILLKMVQKELFWGGAEWVQMALKIFLEYFYTHSLFLQTCLGPWVSPRANGMVVQPTIPFLLPQTQPNGHFLALIPILSLKSSKRECWWMGGLGLRRSRKIFGALPDMVIMFGDIPRSIAIFQSKRGGHTTPHSVFITTNVSIWWNLGVDHRFWG